MITHYRPFRPSYRDDRYPPPTWWGLLRGFLWWLLAAGIVLCIGH